MPAKGAIRESGVSEKAMRSITVALMTRKKKPASQYFLRQMGMPTCRGCESACTWMRERAKGEGGDTGIGEDR
eukprot:scaffold19195_cov35-Tisochrysis_lutea.AAC.2